MSPPANEVCEDYVFIPVCQSFCSQGGGVYGTGGMCGGGACVAGPHMPPAMHTPLGGGMCGGRGACVAGGHAWQGGWQEGGIDDGWVCGGMCGGGHAWQGGHVWQGACMPCTPPRHYEIRSVNAWAVHILLECILVLKMKITKISPLQIW